MGWTRRLAFDRMGFLRRDGLFFCVLLQALIYLFVAPAFSVSGKAYAGEYSGIQLDMLWWYVLPLVLSYCLLVWRFLPVGRDRLELALAQGWRAWLFLALVALVLLAHWGVAFEQGLLTRRISSALVAQRFASLSFSQLFAMKLHDQMILPLGAVIVALLTSEGLRGCWLRCRRSPVMWALLMAGAGALLFALLNTRSMLILVFALGGCIALSIWRYSLSVFYRVAWRLVCAAVLCILVLMALRALYLTEEGWGRAASSAEWSERLDCVDLIARIAPRLQAEGFEHGRAWDVPLTVSFAWLGDSLRVKEMKAREMSTSKAYLLEKYTDISLRDHPSCSLTDAYANFGRLGFLVAALMHASLLFLVAFVFWRRGRWASLVLIPAVALMLFEYELIGQLLLLVKAAPVVFIFALLQPFSLRRVGGDPAVPA